MALRKGEVVTMASASPASITNCTGVEFPAMFEATTVNVNLPLASGVPVIAPVFWFSDKPVGRLPLVIVHVMGVEPVAVN